MFRVDLVFLGFDFFEWEKVGFGFGGGESFLGFEGRET